jgi:CDP-paratose 2-epimerase
MKILITGICGFTGSTLARAFKEFTTDVDVSGIDNFLRPGSEHNRAPLKAAGVRVFHGDTRCASDFDLLPTVDWVIDAAANPSVLAGVSDESSSRQTVEHNLSGTINLLEYCKRTHAGVVLLSTSRVYSITALANVRLTVENGAYRPQIDSAAPRGLTAEGIAENFSTAPPLSIYGATKLASELLALEYGAAFSFPVWVDRCGVLAGASQFGKADQGIFSFWINSYLRRRPLRYFGFDGAGHQVRDCLHPRDLAALIWRQMQAPDRAGDRMQNVGGGVASAMSLAQLSAWCAARFGEHKVGRESASRAYDLPWVVLDATRARQQWDWRPSVPLGQILEEIAQHAQSHPNWLEISGAQ